MSQLDLALVADTSTRHLSYLETGRSRPGLGVILSLAEALDLPLRARNDLLVTAGYPPHYSDAPLDAPELDLIRQAVDATLESHEPFPAFAVDRRWNVVKANRAMAALLGALRSGGSQHDNILLQIFDPDDMRPAIANWDEVAGGLLRHLHYDLSRFPGDSVTETLLKQIMSFPEIPPGWRHRNPTAPPAPAVQTAFRSPVGELRFFSTVTTFVGAGYVAAEELRIECMHPTTEATRAFCLELSPQTAGGDAPHLEHRRHRGPTSGG